MRHNMQIKLFGYQICFEMTSKMFILVTSRILRPLWINIDRFAPFGQSRGKTDIWSFHVAPQKIFHDMIMDQWAKADHFILLPKRVNPIGQQNNLNFPVWINPERCTGKAQMTDARA